ncbi:MAG: hypothetical protein IPI10_14060 [Bacteroidetes bacterium]|nr:hypothetical protein [Bacteroidota bacterium]
MGKEVTSKKNLFKVDINNILIIINMNDSLKSVMENLALEYDKKGKENINDSGAANEGGVSKFWNYLKYGSLISFILILFAWLFIEYRNLIRKIKEKDKTIKELKSQLQSANIKLNQSVDKGSESFLKSKNSLVKPIASSEILDDAIVKLKNNPPNIAGSILLSLIDNNRNAWLDKLESEYNGKFNVRDTDKAQFILDYVKHDVERIVKDDYYDLKRVVELLDVQNLLGGQEWLKKYKKIAPERAEQIAKNKANELQVKLPNNSLIAKLEFDKLKTESLKEIEIAIREEEANMDTIMYSSQPVGEGYFIKEKLSDEILGQHMYKILISTKNPDTARFQFLFDNEKAMKTAIASYSTALVPVCILEKDNTKGERIVPTQDNGFGTLRLENDRWKVQEKLRIRIV